MISHQPATDSQPASPNRAWPELWVLGLLALLFAVVVGHWYVYHGADRELALWLYGRGRFAAVLVACGLGAVGILMALLRPPMLRGGRLWGVLLTMLVIFSAPVPYAYPSSRREAPSEVTLQFPVRGQWRVLAGGRVGAHNPLSLEPSRCHGLLLAREVDGSRWKPTATDRVDPSQGYTLGADLYAPAAGEVVAAVGDEADRSFQLRVEEATGRGNHLVVRLASGEYLILAHLLRGSLQVAVGDRVEVGQPIAKVGSSGRGIPLTEPHLDMHLSTRPEEGEGEGIPFLLGGYFLDGQRVPAGQPKGGLGGKGAPLGDLLVLEKGAGGGAAGPDGPAESSR